MWENWGSVHGTPAAQGFRFWERASLKPTSFNFSSSSLSTSVHLDYQIMWNMDAKADRLLFDHTRLVLSCKLLRNPCHGILSPEQLSEKPSTPSAVTMSPYWHKVFHLQTPYLVQKIFSAALLALRSIPANLNIAKQGKMAGAEFASHLSPVPLLAVLEINTFY